jgi:hypothetical protein
MRIIGWVLAAVLLVLTFGAIANAQSEQDKDKGKAHTKVYSYKKTAPTPAPSRAARAEARERLGDAPHGSQIWWRDRAERYSSGDGGSP